MGEGWWGVGKFRCRFEGRSSRRLIEDSSVHQDHLNSWLGSRTIESKWVPFVTAGGKHCQCLSARQALLLGTTTVT